jgi:2-oxoglutarate ferredoxin oxidoreductase subunit gamma
MKKVKSSNKLEIRFAGAGGQGLQAAATVLGKSLIRSSKKYVCQSQNYGPESRGGLSYSDLIISDEEIDFPKIKIPDVLVCMSQESFLRFKPELIDGSVKTLVIDPEMVSIRDLHRRNDQLDIHTISATLASEEILGNRIASNMVLVGALYGILNVCDSDAVEQVLANEWPLLAEKNIAAFRRGIELVKESRKS